MRYTKLTLFASIWLTGTFIDAEIQLNFNDLPPEAVTQIQSLSPEEREDLLKKYDIDYPVTSSISKKQISSLGDNVDIIEVDPDKDKMINSIFEDLERLNEQNTKKNKPERFGLSFFSQKISTFAPVDDISVPDNYVLGIGDSLVIQTMGSSFDRYELQVQRDGNIVIENLGIVSVAGLSINEASQLIKKRFTQELFGLNVAVSLGKLRAMNIFMAGEVNNPGMYSVSSLTTITQALYQSGGITDLGSLRNIKILRNGKNIITFDVYDLLVYGDSSNDIRLRSGDVVLIGSYKKLVTIEGESKRPMVYELLPNETVSDLLRISSGLTQQASPSKATLVSKKALGSTPEIISLNLLDQNSLDMVLGVDDTLMIPKANSRPRNYIELIGALYRSGPVGWKKGMLLSDLFSSIEENFPNYVDLNFSMVSRKSLYSNEREYIFFSLRELFNNKTDNDIQLMEFDKVYIFSMSLEESKEQSLEESKEQNKPNDLISEDQSTKNENTSKNFDTSLKTTGILSDEGLKYTREKLLEDEIKLAKLNSNYESSLPLISISGAVKFPGIYPLFKNANISMLIKAAGGLTDDAFLKSAELRRYLYQDLNYEIKLSEVNLSQESTQAYDTYLKPKDHLNVRKISDWNRERAVSISGEVRYPGTYLISSSDNLSTIIERAGGFKNSAFIEGSVFRKKSIKELEIERLKSYTDTLKQKFSAISLTQEKSKLEVSELEAIIKLITSIEPSGRIAIDWNNEQSLESISIEDGDSLFVPEKTNLVQVLGEVNVPNVLNYSNNLRVEDYIQLAGGLTRRADDTIYIIKANGSSIVLENSLFRIMGSRPVIEPGDSVIVPVNIQYTDSLTNWTQITQVIYQSMVSLAAVKGL